MTTGDLLWPWESSCGHRLIMRVGQGLTRMASPAWHFNSSVASHKVRLISRAHGPPAPRQTSARCCVQRFCLLFFSSVHPSAHSRVCTNTRGNPNAEIFGMCGVLIQRMLFGVRVSQYRKPLVPNIFGLRPNHFGSIPNHFGSRPKG